jgi:hypothetical protein
MMPERQKPKRQPLSAMSGLLQMADNDQPIGDKIGSYPP